MPATTAASVSCLVISRSAPLLNRMLASLNRARSFWSDADEVLCSWNGSREEEDQISSSGPPSWRIAQRRAYHFASNMNQLADLARGEVLVLINDDVVLDAGSLDRAIQVLDSETSAAIVGGRLRSSDGRLTHAGILISNQNLPYNRLRPERLAPFIGTDDLIVQEAGAIPAVTGALMVMRRADFQAVRFREHFRVCGEDVALCLDCLRCLGRGAYYASDVTAIHDEKSTRGPTLDHYDQQRVAALIGELGPATAAMRAAMGHWAVQEADRIEAVVHLLQSELAAQRQDLIALQQSHQELQRQLSSRRQRLRSLLGGGGRRLAAAYRTLASWLSAGSRRT